MTQEIILGLIIVAAIVMFARHLRKPSCGCGCSCSGKDKTDASGCCSNKKL